MPPPLEMTVVIPFYNAAATLPGCIEALEAQRYPRERFEIILVDNNSTDGSAEIVGRYPGVHLLREEAQGAYVDATSRRSGIPCAPSCTTPPRADRRDTSAAVGAWRACSGWSPWASWIGESSWGLAFSR